MKRFATFFFAMLLSLLIANPNNTHASTYPTASYEVSGQAQIWEASYNYRVKAGKKIIQQGHGQASQGAPGWGNFKQMVKVDKKYGKNLTLELYWVSPEDGREKDKLTIPLNNSGGKEYNNKSFHHVRVYILK